MSTDYEPLPFVPETFEAICARFPAAVAHVITFDEMQTLVRNRQGPGRANVFDFADGIRCIVTSDRPYDIIYTHFSFGVFIDFQSIWFAKSPFAFSARCREILQAFGEKKLVTLPPVGMEHSQRAVHFFCKSQL